MCSVCSGPFLTLLTEQQDDLYTLARYVAYKRGDRHVSDLFSSCSSI